MPDPGREEGPYLKVEVREFIFDSTTTNLSHLQCNIMNSQLIHTRRMGDQARLPDQGREEKGRSGAVARLGEGGEWEIRHGRPTRGGRRGLTLGEVNSGRVPRDSLAPHPPFSDAHASFEAREAQVHASTIPTHGSER